MEENRDMDRLGSLDPQALTGESKRLYDDMIDFFGDGESWKCVDSNSTPENIQALTNNLHSFVYKFPNGRMIGPVSLQLPPPKPSDHFHNTDNSLGLNCTVQVQDIRGWP